MKKIYSKFSLLVVTLLVTISAHGQHVSAVHNFQATRLVPGSALKASGSYRIWYGNDKTSSSAPVTKPVIVVEGWDKDNLVNNQGIYWQLNGGLRASLTNNGYDVITLNFNNPDWGLQFNAMLLIELIEEINDNLKSGNEELVVIGMSMGGVIARYALKTMENLNLNHETRLYVSYDAPHQGATLPEGLYTLASHMANMTFSLLNQPIVYFRNHSAGLLDLYNTLTSPSVNQMLKNSGSYHALWQTELDNLGYPENLRRVAVSNGSMRGLRQRNAQGAYLNPGDLLMSWQDNGLFFGINDVLNGNLQVRSSSSGVKIADLDIDFGTSFNFQVIDFDDYATSSDKPYEIHAGGYFPIDNILGDITDVLPAAQVNLQNGFTFIPFASALDIHPNFSGYLDLNLNEVNAGIPGLASNWDILCYSPFDNIIAAPFDNEEHLEMTQRTSDWIFAEIQGQPTATLCRNFCPSQLSLTSSSDPLCDGATRLIEIEDLVGNYTINWTVGSGLEIVGASNGSSITVRNKLNNSSSNGSVVATITTPCDYSSQGTASTNITLGGSASTLNISYQDGPLPLIMCISSAPVTVLFSAYNYSGASYYEWQSDLPGFPGGISPPSGDKYATINVPSGYVGNHYIKVRAYGPCGYTPWVTRNFELRYDPQGCGFPFPDFQLAKSVNDLGEFFSGYGDQAISFYNHQGQLIYQGKASFAQIGELDKARVPDGLYIVHIGTTEGLIRKQIMLRREEE